MVINCSVAS
jgi:hypothetical protein